MNRLSDVYSRHSSMLDGEECACGWRNSWKMLETYEEHVAEEVMKVVYLG